MTPMRGVMWLESSRLRIYVVALRASKIYQ